jgi:transcriptional regulator with XRE-family HTH domain
MPKISAPAHTDDAQLLTAPDSADAVQTLGDRLASARDAQGLSAAQLARRVGVKTETLHAWEAGRSGPRPNVLLRLSGMLNVSPTWLLTGTGDSPAATAAETEMMQIRAAAERLRATLLGAAAELKQLEERLETYESYRP